MWKLERLSADHEVPVFEFETLNRRYFARTISDRGDEFFERFHDGFQTTLAEQASGKRIFYVLVDERGFVVGRFNLYCVHDETADVGYRVAEEVSGRGVATSALSELCRLSLEQGLTRLTAKTSKENIASQRVLEKSGFHVAGSTDVAGRPGIAYERVLRSEPGHGALELS
jgi:[ribosomal protein S5]-alanine N-acetyltransferase